MTLKCLNKIREPKSILPLKRKVLISIGIALSGLLLGAFQKYIDGGVEMPQVFESLDIVNYFGRFAVWLLLGTVISVYASTPARAAVNTFLFFISMVSAYYLYCNFISGFLPVSYMMIWIVLSFVSPFIAYICWYAKGKGVIAVAISAVILGIIFSQAFLIYCALLQIVIIRFAAAVVDGGQRFTLHSAPCMPSNESHVVASELLRSLQNRISFYFAIEGSI